MYRRDGVEGGGVAVERSTASGCVDGVATKICENSFQFRRRDRGTVGWSSVARRALVSRCYDDGSVQRSAAGSFLILGLDLANPVQVARRHL